MSMKTNELRIGNFVKLGKRKNTLEVYGVKQFDVGVEGISNELNVYLMDKKYIYNVVSDEDIKPIPLTEEWLLKFGFEHCGSYFKLNNVILYIDWNNKYRYQYNYGQRWIKHVHQLQNLYFALTGDELTIQC